MKQMGFEIEKWEGFIRFEAEENRISKAEYEQAEAVATDLIGAVTAAGIIEK